ncbi:FHA domain-containing protein [Methylocella sp.]|uniref:FHA domain-containing protein n=1 Tax=Methylocella sp. TaxID=1978226 RepID=UPI003C239A0B
MNASGVHKIVIRHVSGSKANQIEEFSLKGRTELRIGRDPSCDIVYDSGRDDVVSRNHAVIGVSAGVRPTFTIEDLGSSNGTFLNNEQISEKTELLPDDILTFGKGGPSFAFDVQPRPAGIGPRTRIIDVAAPAATRILGAEEAATSASLRAATGTSVVEVMQDEPMRSTGKVGIGKETLLHELAKERGAANRTWFSVLGALAAAAVIAGGWLYWRELASEQAQQKSLADIQGEAQRAKEQGQEAEAQTTAALKQRLGMSPQDIVRQYGTATAKVTAQWRLFDQTTGRPIFQKTYTDKDNKTYGMYVKLPNGTVVPDLTLDDEGRHNRSIGRQINGTAFVVSDRGFLLTNKHLAAAWRLPFFDCSCVEKEGLLIEDTGHKNPKVSIISLDDPAYKSLKDWVPESGGLIFDAKKLRVVGDYNNIPDPSKNEQHNFEGRNEALDVTFAGNRLGISAALVRSSNDSDAALIKIDSPDPLQKVDIATDDDVASGDRAIVLGFPSVAADTFVLSDTIENGVLKTNQELVPEPYVTEGIVALVSNKIVTKNGITVEGAQGNIIQLTINSTGAGNSGGPVFNSVGKVIGLFTYLTTQGSTVSSAAVPIKYGRELLKSQ